MLAGEQLADLADRQAATGPVQDVADALHILGRVQAMAAFGALRADQPVATLPGAQGYRVDAGQAHHIAHGQQIREVASVIGQVGIQGPGRHSNPSPPFAPSVRASSWRPSRTPPLPEVQ
jgi:hypothetical protein